MYILNKKEDILNNQMIEDNIERLDHLEIKDEKEIDHFTMFNFSSLSSDWSCRQDSNLSQVEISSEIVTDCT